MTKLESPNATIRIHSHLWINNHIVLYERPVPGTSREFHCDLPASRKADGLTLPWLAIPTMKPQAPTQPSRHLSHWANSGDGGEKTGGRQKEVALHLKAFFSTPALHFLYYPRHEALGNSVQSWAKSGLLASQLHTCFVQKQYY